VYARALRIIRDYHRLSQADAALKVGLSKSYVSELEAGSKKASLEVLERYSEAFDIPLSSLMLFAERTQDAKVAERTRIFAAEKVLKMLEWLRDTTDEGKQGKRSRSTKTGSTRSTRQKTSLVGSPRRTIR
jgi:transcriptional regulator with XRE-family HTH domain